MSLHAHMHNPVSVSHSDLLVSDTTHGVVCFHSASGSTFRLHTTPEVARAVAEAFQAASVMEAAE